MDDGDSRAELPPAAVVARRARMNMPNTHYLCQSERGGGLVAQADCILSLEPVDLFGQLNDVVDQLERVGRPRTKKGANIISISTRDLSIRANYQDSQRYMAADLNI